MTQTYWEARLTREGMPAEIRTSHHFPLHEGESSTPIASTPTYAYWAKLGQDAHEFQAPRYPLAKVRRYMAKLAMHGNVARACRETGTPRQTAIRWIKVFAKWRATHDTSNS